MLTNVRFFFSHDYEERKNATKTRDLQNVNCDVILLFCY